MLRHIPAMSMPVIPCCIAAMPQARYRSGTANYPYSSYISRQIALAIGIPVLPCKRGSSARCDRVSGGSVRAALCPDRHRHQAEDEDDA